MRRIASMSAGVVTDMVYRIQRASLGSPDCPSIVRNAVAAAPRGRAPPLRHQGARGVFYSNLELVLGREVDLATLNRPGKEHIAEASRRAELAGIAFREADLVGQVRALDAQLPVLLEARDETGPEHVVAAEGLSAHDVLVALAGVLIRHPSGHIPPGERLTVTRGDPDLEFRLALQRCTVGRGARDEVAQDVRVPEAT